MLKLMSTQPRDALNRLIAALEYHFDAAQSGPGDSDAVEAAEQRLCDAFVAYDDSLFTRFGVDLPFDLVDDEEESDEPDDVDEEDLGEGEEADDTELDDDAFDDGDGDDGDVGRRAF